MPDWGPEIRRRLTGVRLRAEREAEIVDEVAQHLEDRYWELTDNGSAPEAATVVVLRELDEEGVLAREVANSEPVSLPMPPPGTSARGSILSGLWQDIRYATRRLVKRPAFTLAAIVTVALSVGPTTAVLGMADALFFRPQPGITAPDRLFNMQFGKKYEAGSFGPTALSYANMDDILSGAATVAAMTGHTEFSAGLSANDAQPRRIDGQSVRANFFDVLGVKMAAGRGFVAEEDASPGGVASIVLAEAMSRDLFASATAAIGQTVQLNSVSFTVVGVANSEFEGSASPPAKFWITGMAYARARHFAPARWAFSANQGPFNRYIARLKAGASVAAAETELLARGRRLTGDRDGSREFAAVDLQVLPGLGAPKSLNVIGYDTVRLLAIVAAVLVLLGMANMANLLVFHGLKLAREIGIRKALGASAARLIQLTLVESVMLSVIGAAAGVAIALGIQTLLGNLTVRGVGTVQVPLDWRVLGATAALAILTGVGFGLAPALLAARGSVLGALGRGIRGELPRVGRLRQSLAAVQLALSLTLLIGAMLFLGTLKNLRAVDLGFDGSNVTTMTMDLKSHGYDTPRMFAYYAQLIGLLKQQPGVDSAATAYTVPAAAYSSTMFPGGSDPKSRIEVWLNFVSSEYFDVMRTPVARGRAFTAPESFGAAISLVILSDTAAKKLFGDADPLGRIVVLPGRPSLDLTVIGITAEERWSGPRRPPNAIAYMPFGPATIVSGASVMVRSSRPSQDVAKLMRTAAASLDRSAPLFRDQTMTDVMNARLGQERLFAWVLSILGAIGFSLAAVGLHGLISQMVGERARELGIRIAIGASRRTVVVLVLKQAAIVTAIGVAAGLAMAFLTGRLIESKLFGLSSRDPVTYVAAVGLLVLVVALALIGPARAALGVQPISVLRSE